MNNSKDRALCKARDLALNYGMSADRLKAEVGRTGTLPPVTMAGIGGFSYTTQKMVATIDARDVLRRALAKVDFCEWREASIMLREAAQKFEVLADLERRGETR